MKKTPLQEVKDRFESKDKLVDAILPLIETKGAEVKRRLARTSNLKLLNLYQTGLDVKRRFGGRKQLIEAILEVDYPNGKAPEPYKTRLDSYTIKRLLDLHRQKAKS